MNRVDCAYIPQPQRRRGLAAKKGDMEPSRTLVDVVRFRFEDDPISRTSPPALRSSQFGAARGNVTTRISAVLAGLSASSARTVPACPRSRRSSDLRFLVAGSGSRDVAVDV